MYFDRVFITAEGYELLGAATAGSSGDESNSPKIFWENAITSSNSIVDWTQSQINGATSSDFPTDTYTSSGSVTSAVHNQKDKTVDDQTIKVDVVTVTIDINNNQHSGIANTLCVFARLDGGESKLVIIASADNPDTVHPLPEPYNAIIDLYIELSDTAVSEVSADQSWYASADAFNKIANRVVTTHSEYSSTVGENQDVYGIKTFKDQMYTGHVTPLNDLDVDLGDSAHNYKNVFTRTVSQSVMECSTAANIAAKLVVSAQAPNFSTPKSGDRILVKFTNGNSSAISTIKIGDSGEYAVIGLRTDLSAGSVVPLTFNGSSWNVDGFLSTASQVVMTVNNDDSEYSVIFTNTQRTRPISGVPLNKELYIDLGTDGNLKYNPGTNTLTCSTFDGEATQLSESPVLNFTDADHSGNNILYSTLNVEAGGKTSNTVTINTVKQAYNAFIRTSAANTNYTIPFTSFSQTSSFRTLYTDDQSTSGTLSYNPGTNTLTCATFSGTATRATADAIGNNIANRYIVSVSVGQSVNSSIIRTIYDRAGTQTNTVYYPHNKYITAVKGSGNTAAMHPTYMPGLISQVIAGSPVHGSTGDAVGVGAIRLVTFKATRALSEYPDGCAIPGSIITTAMLRTKGNDSENVLRVDSSNVEADSGDLSGTWKILHKLGYVSTDNCVVALAIRII